jgi:hypothetical protein
MINDFVRRFIYQAKYDSVKFDRGSSQLGGLFAEGIAPTALPRRGWTLV